MSNYLTVPIRVDGLWLSKGMSAMEAPVQLGDLPYRNNSPQQTGYRGIRKPSEPLDEFSDTAFISENFVAQPFDDQNFWLGQGVHLHWTLPKALTTGTQGESGIEYPAIPNRWLVVRSGGGLSGRQWVVESDYLWPLDAVPSGRMAPVAYPLDKVVEGSPPVRRMGRAVITTNGYHPSDKDHYLGDLNQQLTAVGFGDPAFLAFYPSCHSLFGLWDSEVSGKPSADLIYQVYGWYSDPQGNDPFLQFIDAFNTLSEAEIRQRIGLNAVADSPATTEGAGRSTTDSDYINAFLDQLQNDKAWQIDPGVLKRMDNSNEIRLNNGDTAGDPWGGMNCIGQITLRKDGWTDAPNTPPVSENVTVSIGNSGTEALSAMLADQLSKGNATSKQQYENQLEALTMVGKFDDREIDIGPNFENARHLKTFSAVSADELWSLRTPEPQSNNAQNKASAGDPLDVPARVAVALDNLVAQLDDILAAGLGQLNDYQMSYNRGRQRIQQLRQQIYNEWYKYMQCSYHHSDQVNNYPDPDAARALVEKSVASMDLLRMFVGQLSITNTAGKPQAASSPVSADWGAMRGSSIAAFAIDIYEAVHGEGALSPENTFDVDSLFDHRESIQKDFANWLFGFMGLADTAKPKNFPLSLPAWSGAAASDFVPLGIWTWITEQVIPNSIDPSGWYPTHTLADFTVSSAGSGYSPTAQLHLHSENGNGAAAQLEVDGSGKVTGATVLNPGEGYLTPPDVWISDGGGAQITPIVKNGAIVDYLIDLQGSGYGPSPTVTITGSGSGAKATAVSGQGQVIGIDVVDGGSGFTCNQVNVTGEGYGAVLYATVNGTSISGINVLEGGFGYSNGSTVQGCDDSGNPLMVGEAVVDSNGAVTAVTLGPQADNLYANTVTTATVNIYGDGTGAEAVAIVNSDGEISSFYITNPGSNYSVPPDVVISGGSGTVPTASASVANGGEILSITSTVSGSGYPVPTITFTGENTAALINPVVGSDKTIQGLRILESGGYTPMATISDITGGNGTGAKVGLMLNGSGGILAVNILDPGSGYQPSLKVVITDTGGGQGAEAVALISAENYISGYKITNPGGGYSQATTSVSILDSSGNAIDATISVTVTNGQIASIGSSQLPLASSQATISFQGSSDSAAAQVVIGSSGQVDSVIIMNPGSGYTTPTVSAPTDPSGTTATIASITLDENGGIIDIQLDDPGSGYTPTPVVTLGGTGAELTANVLADNQLLFTSIADLATAQIGWLTDITDQLQAVVDAAQGQVAANSPDLSELVSAVNALGEASGLADMTNLLAQAIDMVESQPASTAKTDAQQQLCRYLLGNITAYSLQSVGAPRFWQPNEPSLLINGESSAASDRHAKDKGLCCVPTNLDISGAVVTDLFTGVSQTLNTLQSNTATKSDLMAAAQTSSAILSRSSNANPWHPLYFEWEAGLLPLQHEGNIEAERRRYGINFVRDNYQLYGDATEFLRLGTNRMVSGSTSTFRGRSIITPHAPDLMRTAIENYIVTQTLTYAQNQDSPSAAINTLLATDSSDTQPYLNYFDNVTNRKAIIAWCDQQHHIQLVKAFIRTPVNSSWISDYVTRCYQQYQTAVTGTLLHLSGTTSDAYRSAFNANTSTIMAWLGNTLTTWFKSGNTEKAPAALILSDDTIPAPEIAEIVKFNAVFVQSGQADAVSLSAALKLKTDKDLITFYGNHSQSILYWLNAQIDGEAEEQSAIHLVAKARNSLASQGAHIQSQALSGFNAALLMQVQTMQLPVQDPLGFDDYQAFTDSLVKPAVGSFNRFAPNPDWDFQPVRNGDMQLSRLQLIDNFGRVLPLTVKKQSRTTQMTRDADTDNWSSLPARLSQPARINFRWMSADGSYQEANPHPLTNPICGWLIPNNLDGSLMIHDNGGTALGYIDQTGVWRSPPGLIGPVMPADIPNPFLATAVQWICDRAQAANPNNSDASIQFMSDFLAVLDSALENISPDNFKQHESRALLMGRPIALIRAMINLELQAGASLHHGWDPFRRRLQGHPPKTDGYQSVQFPVRLGEHEQLNDGVVGYWLEEKGQFATRYTLNQSVLAKIVAPPFNMPKTLVAKLQPMKNKPCIGKARFQNQITALLGEEDTLAWINTLLNQANQGDDIYLPQSNANEALDQDDNLVIYQTRDKALNFYQSLNDPPQMATLLMDPRCLAHCTTGVLPTKSIDIPPAFYADVLTKINVTFLSAPVLSDPTQIKIPLPQESGFGWSWRQQIGNDWQQLTTTPTVTVQLLTDAYGAADGQQIWANLIQQNWVAPNPGNAATGTLLPPKQRQPLPDLRNTAVATLLAQQSSGTVPITTLATPYPDDYLAIWNALITAGWLTETAATVTASSNRKTINNPQLAQITSWMYGKETVTQTSFSSAFPTNSGALWNSLVLAGWLVPNATIDSSVTNRIAAQNKPFTDTRSDDIQAVLETGEQVLATSNKEARFGQTQVIHEGWLSLQPETAGPKGASS